MEINVNAIKKALEEIEETRGISRDVSVQILKDAFARGFRKQLGGDDAEIEINFDLDKGILEMYQIKNVVKEVEDDFLEISVEDANAEDKSKKYHEGDKFYIPASIEQMSKTLVLSIKSAVRQKISEAEKNYLLETFKDKIGTMITGVVERVDDLRGADINIGRTSVFLPKSQMIGDEKLYPRDSIKLFVSDVIMTPKGAKINVSRSNEGFLAALFNEEIHEIYDGTILIKSIARRAGERSKVAVYSLDPSVDPAGACIGPNGSRIQKIVAQLGNGTQKEKIDIIDYSDNLALYIMDSLKPAPVVGIALNTDGENTATVVVKDESLSLAIGKRGVNVHLACKLTGVDIKIMTEEQASESNLVFQSFEEIQALDLQNRAKKAEKEQEKNKILPTLPEGYVAPQERVYEEETNDFDESLLEQSEKEEILASTTHRDIKEDVEVESEKEEEAEVEEKVETVAPAIQKVTTTTTLEDLEKSLQEEEKPAKSKYSRPNKKSSKSKEEHDSKDEKAEPTYTKDPSKYMSIYTQEELDEMEDEEYEEDIQDDEDIDYDEYEEYYDDDDK